MFHAIVGATCRMVHGAYGAVVMAFWARRHGVDLAEAAKDAFAAFRLLRAPHVEGLTAQQAVTIVRKAYASGLKPLDLWIVYRESRCDDYDHAVSKALAMRELFANEKKESN